MILPILPYTKAVVLTKDDNTDLADSPSRALWVGGAGNIAVDFLVGPTNVLISGIPAGTLLPFAIKRLRSTNTTATLVAALY